MIKINDIDFCYETIFSFLSLREIIKLRLIFINNKLNISRAINNKKQNNIYKLLLNKILSIEELNKINIYFFRKEYLHKKSKFIFENYIQNLLINNETHIFIANLKDELIYIKKINEKSFICLFNIKLNKSIYYTFYNIDKNGNFQLENINKSGYLIYNGVENNQNVLDYLK